MTLLDEFRKSIGGVRTLASLGVESAERGVKLFNSWADTRESNARLREFDEKIAKSEAESRAKGGATGKHDPERDPKSLHFDPFDLVAIMGYRERPSGLSYGAMEGIGNGMPVVADVIRTRVNQTTAFMKRPEDRHSPGFKVRPKDWENTQTTPAMEQRQREIEDVILNTGFADEDNPDERGVSFQTFGRTFIWDSLKFDQATFEVVPDRKGDPSYLTIVDPTTVRLLDPGARESGDPFAVQVINGSIVADFLPSELAFCVRNHRSSIRAHGYGISEIESLVREITGFLWGMEYNRKFFTQGSATKGILNFKGTIPDKHLTAFRRQWYAMVSGVSNAWRTPITNAEELQWINLQMSNRDMEYSAWMDFLIKITCARFQIAPEEVQFSYGNTGQSSAMGQAPIEEKLKASRDLGLRPLVWFLFDCINEHFVNRLDPDFEAVPVGLDQVGPEAETELLGKQVKIYKTVDEVRAQVGDPPLPDGKGECILDPTWLQFAQGIDGMEADEEGDGEFDNTVDIDDDTDDDGDFMSDGIDGEDAGEDADLDSTPEDTVKSSSPRRVVRYEIEL